MADELFRDDDLIRVVGREGILIAAGDVGLPAADRAPQGRTVWTTTATPRRTRSAGCAKHVGWVYAVDVRHPRGGRADPAAIVRRLHDKVTGPGLRGRAGPGDPAGLGQATPPPGVAVQAYDTPLPGGHLTPEGSLSTYYRQSKVFATILGCPFEETLPATYPEFRDVLRETCSTPWRSATPPGRSPTRFCTPILPKGRLYGPGPRRGPAHHRRADAGADPHAVRLDVEHARQGAAGPGCSWGTLRVIYPRLPLRLRTLPQRLLPPQDAPHAGQGRRSGRPPVRALLPIAVKRRSARIGRPGRSFAVRSATRPSRRACASLRRRSRPPRRPSIRTPD